MSSDAPTGSLREWLFAVRSALGGLSASGGLLLACASFAVGVGVLALPGTSSGRQPVTVHQRSSLTIPLGPNRTNVAAQAARPRTPSAAHAGASLALPSTRSANRGTPAHPVVVRHPLPVRNPDANTVGPSQIASPLPPRRNPDPLPVTVPSPPPVIPVTLPPLPQAPPLPTLPSSPPLPDTGNLPAGLP